MTFESNAFQIAAQADLFAYIYIPIGDTLDKMKSLMEQVSPH